MVISVLYVLGEQRNLRNEAIATVRDAATTLDHELRRDLLAMAFPCWTGKQQQTAVRMLGDGQATFTLNSQRVTMLGWH